MKYFTNDEFACKHCGRLPEGGMNPVLLSKLDRLRELVGNPIIVTSGYRCPHHNADVGGVYNSQHMLGNACDIVCSAVSVDHLANLAVECGFDGIGRYYSSGFVHVDCRCYGNEPNEYVWEE